MTNTFLHSLNSLPKITPDSRPKLSKSKSVFRPKRRKNHTLLRGTYLSDLYKGVPPVTYLVQSVYHDYKVRRTLSLFPLHSTSGFFTTHLRAQQTKPTAMQAIVFNSILRYNVLTGRPRVRSARSGASTVTENGPLLTREKLVNTSVYGLVHPYRLWG